MKRKTYVLSAAAVTFALGVAAFSASTSFAHGNRGFGGQMGHGYSQAMMGPHGYGHSPCANWQQSNVDRNLGVDDVKGIVEKHLKRRGNDRLKLGKIESSGETTIIAEIVTVDDSLVQRIEFDTKTGAHRPIN